MRPLARVLVLSAIALLACGRVEGIRSLPMALCTRCRKRLVVLPEPTTQELRTSGCSLDSVISRWSYEPPFDSVIHALKFGRLEFLGEELAGGLHSSLAEAEREVDVVVPIPLHWRRRLTRGYNQAEAIARPLAGLLGLPLVRALRRRRHTRAQARLSRVAREHNLRLAFAPVPHQCARIASRRLLLVDDVVTTGATLEAAAECLREQGATEIRAVTAARTPRSGSVEEGDGPAFLTRIF